MKVHASGPEGENPKYEQRARQSAYIPGSPGVSLVRLVSQEEHAEGEDDDMTGDAVVAAEMGTNGWSDSVPGVRTKTSRKSSGSTVRVMTYKDAGIGTKDERLMWRPQSGPDAMARRARKFGLSKKSSGLEHQALVAKTYWSPLRLMRSPRGSREANVDVMTLRATEAATK